MEPQKQSKTADTIFKALATIGFVVVLVVLIWGGVWIARKAPPALDSVSSAVVTFLSFNLGGSTEDDTATVPTAPPITTPGTPSTNPTTPTTPTTTTKPVTPTPGVKTETSYTFGGTTGGSPINMNGLPDLVPSVVAVGYIDKSTKEFVAQTPIKQEYERKVAVKFLVENKGDNIALNGWNLNVVIPTDPHHIFHGGSMRALLPGEKIEYVISFTQAKSGTVDVIINVDPTCVDGGCHGAVKESNEKNNILKHAFTISN